MAIRPGCFAVGCWVSCVKATAIVTATICSVKSVRASCSPWIGSFEKISSPRIVIDISVGGGVIAIISYHHYH